MIFLSKYCYLLYIHYGLSISAIVTGYESYYETSYSDSNCSYNCNSTNNDNNNDNIDVIVRFAGNNKFAYNVYCNKSDNCFLNANLQMLVQ